MWRNMCYRKASIARLYMMGLRLVERFGFPIFDGIPKKMILPSKLSYTQNETHFKGFYSRFVAIQTRFERITDWCSNWISPRSKSPRVIGRLTDAREGVVIALLCAYSYTQSWCGLYVEINIALCQARDKIFISNPHVSNFFSLSGLKWEVHLSNCFINPLSL